MSTVHLRGTSRVRRMLAFVEADRVRCADRTRWGGTDFGGGDIGDMMHFDAYNTAPAKNLRDNVRAFRDKALEPIT